MNTVIKDNINKAILSFHSGEIDVYEMITYIEKSINVETIIGYRNLKIDNEYGLAYSLWVTDWDELIDEDKYQLEESLDEDKYHHIIKAIFRKK